MGRHTLEGNPPIDVTLRNSARAKRLSLRVSRLDGRVTLTLPARTPDREGIAFLKSKEAWLRKHLADLRPKQTVVVGAHVPYQGLPHLIVEAEVRRTTIKDGRIYVPVGKDAAAQVKALMRVHARDALVASSDRYSAQLGRKYTRLTLRDTRSRWGSCTSQGGLMYSWRLIMAPREVLEYVAAHEVAHLAEMNHSTAFWNVVADLCADYAKHRDWLRREGDILHRIDFGD